MSHPAVTSQQISDVFKAESGRVLATLIRHLGDFDLAEEALQDAFVTAVDRWQHDGVPANPRAWLVSTGRHKGIDTIRRRSRGDELELEQARDVRTSVQTGEWDDETLHDDQLRLIFTCCHPELPIDARIALSLREVCGLTTGEIARAYLVPFETMKKRISRAKRTIRDRRIPYEVPSRSELRNRLGAVMHVVYLVYNEGYAASSGTEHIRRELTREAVFLGRLLADLIPQPEVFGLLALLLFHESRSSTRVDARGDLVPLEKQDRSQWDRELIEEGTRFVQKAFLSGRLGQYSIQAAIASVHAAAESVESTSWRVIVGYYDMLLRIQESPVVRLNRAIAVGMREGLEVGLDLIDALITDGGLATYHLAHVARGDFARRMGRTAEAIGSYRNALRHTRQEPERRYLTRQIKEI